MPVVIHADSHLDHGISEEQVQWVRDQFQDCDAFFIETVTLPTDLGTVPVALHMDVPEAEVFYASRGDREYRSRMTDRPMRHAREVTILAGPHDGQPCVLYTMYGGAPAPKEPGDPELKPEEREESEDFWSSAALSSKPSENPSRKNPKPNPAPTSANDIVGRLKF